MGERTAGFAASPMSVSEAITAARNLPTETPHTKGYNRAEISGTGRTATSFADTEPPATTLNRDLTDPVMDSIAGAIRDTA